MKIIKILSLIVIYILYAIAVITVNNLIGDLLSPILILIAFYYVYRGFVTKENKIVYKWSGLFYALSLFAWFVLDLSWGLSNLIFKVDPSNNPVIVYGYSATNFFLLLAVIIVGYAQLRKLNKIQVILDTLIISICFAVILWVFVFKQDIDRANIINSDIIFMCTLFMDIIILAMINVWFFSTRTTKALLFAKLSAIGGIIFVISDLIYYYQYFYTSYEPNSLLDGGYMLSFTMMALSGYIKSKESSTSEDGNAINKVFYQFNKEVLIISAPVLLLVFQRNQTYYIILLIISILIYYVLSNYTQKTILQEKLLQSERNHVSELEEKVEERTNEIVRIMNTDIVTGLYNRRYVEGYLPKICESLRNTESISLLYIDLNKYNSIKSLFGRFVAEALLLEVGNRIKELILGLDDSALLASYGEDVFVLALKNHMNQEQPMSISKAIINKCTGSYDIENNDIVVTLNIGISCYPFDTSNHEDLIKNAASAMKYARKLGSNRSTQFNENIGSYVFNKNNIEIGLKKVDFDQDFCLHFQPQVSSDTGEIIGAEALIRWYTKDGTYIPPNEFIPITEESGQIIPLGYWIIENAARQQERWRNHSSKEMRMAVNVSVKQLSEKEFIPHLKEIQNRYHIMPQLFEIEITENIQLEGNQDVLDNLKALREIGISIAIDDFGTGYSSLYYLKNLPMDRIKIAKELVDNIENDLYSHSIIQMVIEMSKKNGIKVIAEGVETKEQWECLKELHCDESQGYYFAKPMPGNEFLNMIQTRRTSEVQI